MQTEPRESSFVITTVRLGDDEYAWLRTQASERARAKGRLKGDASEIMRELVAQARESDASSAGETWGEAVIRAMSKGLIGGRLKARVQDASRATPAGEPGEFLLSLSPEGYRSLVGPPQPAPGDVAAIFDRFLEKLAAEGDSRAR